MTHSRAVAGLSRNGSSRGNRQRWPGGCSIPPARGIPDGRWRERAENLVGGASSDAACQRDVGDTERRERPAKLIERVPDSRQQFGMVPKQVSADPIQRRRALTAQHEAEPQRLRREWPVALPSDHRVCNVENLSLWCFGEFAVSAAVNENAVEIEARAPDRVVAAPGAFDAQLVFLQMQGKMKVARQAMPEPNFAGRTGAVLPVQHELESSLDAAPARITIAAVHPTAQPVMREKFLVSVDADQVLERARESCFLMSLQLGQVDHEIGLDDRARDEVLVEALAVRESHVSRIVLGDAKPRVAPADTFEQTLGAEVEQDEIAEVGLVLCRVADAVRDDTLRPPEIMHTAKAGIRTHQRVRPGAHPGCDLELIEIALLERSIADHELRERRLQCCIDDRLDDGAVRDERLNSPGAGILMHDPVRLHQDFRSRRDDRTERTGISGRPAEEIGNPANGITGALAPAIVEIRIEPGDRDGVGLYWHNEHDSGKSGVECVHGAAQLACPSRTRLYTAIMSYAPITN